MIDTRRQFRVLYRQFLVRLIDLEVLSTSGDPVKLFGQLAAVVAAFNLVLAIYLIPQYALTTLSPDKLALAATGDQEFLISTTMALAGIFSVIAWGAVFPDLRDSYILGSLPVRARTIFRAKIAAIGTGLGVTIVAANLCTGLCYPFVGAAVNSGLVGGLRTLVAYWVAVTAAGVFVFCALLALHGLTACLLPYRWYLRVSSLLQVTAFFAVLGVHFITPGSSELSIFAPANRELIGCFPAFWFLGVFQQLNSPVDPMFAALAGRAVWATTGAVVIALATYTFAYFRGMRRIIEQPAISTAGRKGILTRLGNAAARMCARKPVDRAVLLFTARTLARSSQHRLILSVYLGMAMAIALAYAKNMVWAGASFHAQLRRYITVTPWNRPNVPLMVDGLVVLFFALVGTRAVFALPTALRANWIFRVTAISAPKVYYTATRKCLYTLAALPVLLISTLIYLVIWPAAPAVAHIVVMSLVAVIVVERSLRGFRKIPFTCSYLPGKADLTRKLGAYAILFLALTDIGTRMEHYAMQKRLRFILMMAMLAVMAFRARKRWNVFAAERSGLQFQDFETAEVAPLDLHGDSSSDEQGYADAGEPAVEVPWRRRVGYALAKSVAVLAALCIAGAAYEAYESHQESVRTAHIGHLVDIGGRSLNLSCTGEGNPAVIFEAGGGGVGYAWVPIQRQVARFTKACWYDRAGHGLSDPGPYPRDSEASAQDLHELLRRAGITRPVVLVGASLGGFIARVYSGLYPEDVAGIVLADSTHIDERSPIPPPDEANWPDSFYAARSAMTQFLWRVGALRVFFGDDYSHPAEKGLTEQESETLSLLFGPKNLAALSTVPFYASARQARKARHISGRPLIVLTAGLSWEKAHNALEARQVLERHRQWIEGQAQLVRFSDCGRQVVVENSSHCIQCDAPEAIVQAVEEVVSRPHCTPSHEVYQSSR